MVIYLLYAGSAGERHKHCDRHLAALCQKKRWSCAVKSVYCGAGHALKMRTAVTFQVTASPESYVWCQVTRWHEADRAAVDFVLKFLAWFFNLIVCFFTFSNSQLLDSGFTITARTVSALGSYQWGWIHSCISAILPVWKQFLHKEQSETGGIFKICTHVSTELKHRTQNWICKVCWISARIVGTKKKKRLSWPFLCSLLLNYFFVKISWKSTIGIFAL